jgi:hypothetical protein
VSQLALPAQGKRLEGFPVLRQVFTSGILTRCRRFTIGRRRGVAARSSRFQELVCLVKARCRRAAGAIDPKTTFTVADWRGPRQGCLVISVQDATRAAGDCRM